MTIFNDLSQITMSNQTPLTPIAPGQYSFQFAFRQPGDLWDTHMVSVRDHSPSGPLYQYARLVWTWNDMLRQRDADVTTWTLDLMSTIFPSMVLGYGADHVSWQTGRMGTLNAPVVVLLHQDINERREFDSIMVHIDKATAVPSHPGTYYDPAVEVYEYITRQFAEAFEGFPELPEIEPGG